MERGKAIYAALGGAGAWFASLFGGWSSALETLLIFMVVDYVTGLVVAGVFKRSGKTANGALESHQSWKGLLKKGAMLLVVLVAHRLDIELGWTIVRDGVIIAFLVNEAISILENVGLMGVPFPEILTKAIELLNQKGESS